MPPKFETTGRPRKRASRVATTGTARTVVEERSEQSPGHPAVAAAALRASQQAHPLHADVMDRARRIAPFLPPTRVEASVGPAGSLELHTVVGITHIEVNIGPGEKGYDVFLSKQTEADEEHLDASEALVAKLFERARARAH